MQPTPSASYSLTLRVKLSSRAGTLGELTTAIGRAGGDIGAIDIVSVGNDYIIRDITVSFSFQRHTANRSSRRLKTSTASRCYTFPIATFLMHLGGKIEVVSKMPLKTRADLSMAYTPGVARVCEAIHEDPEKAFTLTIKKNTVAVVTDGTAVLGLGDIGPAAAMPVMEGKAMLFKEFGGVDAFPICLNTKDPDEIVRTVKAISTAFGGINLEDISAPRCFEIEERLKEELDIPVFHDDQHGTAVVVLAALINALKIVGKQMERHQSGRERRRRGGRRLFEDHHGRGREEHRRLRPDRRDLSRPQGKHELGQGLVRAEHQSKRRAGNCSRRHQRRGRVSRACQCPA